MKTVFTVIMCIVAFVAFIFGAQYLHLNMTKFFKPKYENVNRQVFENTKSYLHGIQQDLGKYYNEYNKAKTVEDKEVIKEVVKVRFAEVDASNIKSPTLRRFLISMRGY